MVVDMEPWNDFLAATGRPKDWLCCACLMLALATGGCQNLSSTSLIPGLAESRRERQIVRQAENDPFPTPSEVGIQQ